MKIQDFVKNAQLDIFTISVKHHALKSYAKDPLSSSTKHPRSVKNVN